MKRNRCKNTANAESEMNVRSGNGVAFSLRLENAKWNGTDKYADLRIVQEGPILEPSLELG